MNTLGISSDACDLNDREFLMRLHQCGRPATLKEAFGGVPRWAADALARLLKAGAVELTEVGRYRLTPAGIGSLLRVKRHPSAEASAAKPTRPSQTQAPQ